MSATSRSFLALLVALSMLGPMTLNILMPSLPGLPGALNTTKESAQLTLSLYLFGMALSQLLLGPLADRFGRRPVIIGALALYSAASFVGYVAPNIETLVFARVAQSFGATAGLSLSRTMIRDQNDLASSASLIGYVTMAMTISPMLSPLLGAVIDEHLGWRMIFAFCALCGTVSLVLSARSLPETRPASLVAATAGDVARRTLRLAANPRYLVFLGASGFCAALFFGFLGAAPYLVIEAMGRTKSEYGLWFVCLSIGYMTGNFITARGGRRFGIGRLIWWGCLSCLLGTALMLAAALLLPMHPALLFGPAMFVSVGNGLVLPNAIAGGISVDLDAAGAGSGLMGFGQVGIGAVLSFLAATYSQGSTVPLAGLLVMCAVLAVFSGWLSRRQIEQSGR
ncbi:MAG: multidrug effflux MFS transporter [Proteobacteria bacterium]|nr:multidrug effflux MFS transporter [Pseudomonadota bacterium]